ncbi:DUF6804 family protein [Flavobacterium cyclinae]|uniref:DUF6804 family protein n=1 Tax=Flavobacterium cyclinae TaxID=2895947 RepID=UPI001E4DDD96|nr:DUF6804 family protein [Flavobacterium cyclinae]UGS19880.1 hypothetical protein LOS86_07570 [Flavobacterium cyclinae]
MEKLLKIFLFIFLFGCLIDFPYGYYQFVRFAALVGFGYLAFNANEQGYKNEAFVYLALAVLFQPFIKIALGRTIWIIVDVMVGIGLIVSLFFPKSKTK